MKVFSFFMVFFFLFVFLGTVGLLRISSVWSVPPPVNTFNYQTRTAASVLTLLFNYELSCFTPQKGPALLVLPSYHIGTFIS